MLVLVAKKVLVVRRVGVEKADEAGLSVSRSLGLSVLSVSDENSFFPNVFLLQQEKATLFPIVETKKRLLSGLVRGPIVVTNCQNGPQVVSSVKRCAPAMACKTRQTVTNGGQFGFN